jgi:hypothetical protein
MDKHPIITDEVRVIDLSNVNSNIFHVIKIIRDGYVYKNSQKQKADRADINLLA